MLRKHGKKGYPQNTKARASFLSKFGLYSLYHIFGVENFFKCGVGDVSFFSYNVAYILVLSQCLFSKLCRLFVAEDRAEGGNDANAVVNVSFAGGFVYGKRLNALLSKHFYAIA